VSGRIDTHHHVVPPFYDSLYAPDAAVAAMTALYETCDLDEAARHQIDRGTADTLFPRFARSAP
jgi:hypothetical protein